MLRIRAVEEAIAERYPENKMRCPTHLSIGQEAPAAAAGVLLRSDDYAVSGHRAHAHYLAKGGSLPRMIAEIYGKETGCCRGKGGSMHLIDESVGFMGSTAIVSGSIPVGVGLAFSAKLNGTSQVSCIFLGDGAVEEGVFYESVNFAVLKKLPVLFFCENNLYSVYTPLKKRQPEGREIFEMVRAMGIRASQHDGNKPEVVLAETEKALERIRAGGGPEFLELTTYRWREHCGPFFDNDIGYRSPQEFEEWRARDPIVYFEKKLRDAGALSDSEIGDMRAGIAAEVAEAFRFAEASPFPGPGELGLHLFGER